MCVWCAVIFVCVCACVSSPSVDVLSSLTVECLRSIPNGVHLLFTSASLKIRWCRVLCRVSCVVSCWHFNWVTNNKCVNHIHQTIQYTRTRGSGETCGRISMRCGMIHEQQHNKKQCVMPRPHARTHARTPLLAYIHIVLIKQTACTLHAK